MKYQDRTFKVKPNYKAISSPWLEVLKWLVTFGRKGSTHKAVEIETPEHANCRCIYVKSIRSNSGAMRVCNHCTSTVEESDTTYQH